MLSEVEHICQRVGIIRQGRLAQVARLEDLHHIRYHHVEADFAGPVPVDAIRAAEGVDHLAVEGQHVTCTVRGSFSPLLAALEQGHVLNLVSREPSLEEVFLTYYRDEPAEAPALATGVR